MRDSFCLFHGFTLAYDTQSGFQICRKCEEEISQSKRDEVTMTNRECRAEAKASKKLRDEIRQWLYSGGAGFEGGADGTRAVSFSFEGLLDVLESYHGDLVDELLEAERAATPQVCHPAACRDEMIWRDELEKIQAATIEAAAQRAENIDVNPETNCLRHSIALSIRNLHTPNTTAELDRTRAKARLEEARWWHFRAWSKEAHIGKTCEEIATNWPDYVASLYDGCRRVVELEKEARG